MSKLWTQFSRFNVSPSVGCVLMHNVLTSPEAENDADRTVQEIMKELDNNRGTIPKALMETALYCCNMENERGMFWHPLNWSFDQFVRNAIPMDLHFDKFYNVIYEKKKTKKGPAGESLGSNT